MATGKVQRIGRTLQAGSRTESRSPKPCAQVRILPGAPGTRALNRRFAWKSPAVGCPGLTPLTAVARPDWEESGRKPRLWSSDQRTTPGHSLVIRGASRRRTSKRSAGWCSDLLFEPVSVIVFRFLCCAVHRPARDGAGTGRTTARCARPTERLRQLWRRGHVTRVNAHPLFVQQRGAWVRKRAYCELSRLASGDRGRAR